MVLALDIGGANLKAADGQGFAASCPFPLWREPQRLAQALAELLAAAPPSETIAATMTGELADCFATKAEGVTAIVAALCRAAPGRTVRIYRTDGRLVPPEAAIASPLLAAAANWHALARFAARYARSDPALVIDIGSTTTDIIPLVNGGPAALGKTDPERLRTGELVYTGVERTPVCALVSALPWRGAACPVARELFATAWDGWLTLGQLPEETDATHTADGRPATRAHARDRLARSICADREIFDDADARQAALAIARAQEAQVAEGLSLVVERLRQPPRAVIVSGRGEFLARRVVAKVQWSAPIVSLAEELGSAVSQVATAHALAVLVREM